MVFDTYTIFEISLMNKFIIKAETRELTGRKVKALRREGKLPANVYGRDVKSMAVTVDLKEFNKVFKEAGETGIVEIEVGKETKPTLIKNVQTDPVTDTAIHADFLQVDLKQKVTAQIPVEIIGESPAEKQGVGTVVLYMNEIEVEALPADLPDNFEIDATLLENVDDAVYVKDLKIDKTKIEIISEEEQIVVKVEPPKEEKPEPEPVAEGEEVVEDETPAEGVTEESTEASSEDTKE